MIEYTVRVDGTETRWFLKQPDGTLKLHRENGPAIERANGDKHWYLNDQNYTEADFNAEMATRSAPSCNGKFVEVDGKKYKLVEV